MNAYLYTYKGEPIQVLAQSNDADLIQVGDIYVRVGKICPYTQKRNVQSERKKPVRKTRLYLVKND